MLQNVKLSINFEFKKGVSHAYIYRVTLWDWCRLERKMETQDNTQTIRDKNLVMYNF